MDLLLTASDPREIVKGDSPAAHSFREAKAEVAAALNEAKKAAPRFSGDVALIRMHTGCQVHPLIAQTWRTRLPKHIVIAANSGYLPGRVNFSMRTATGTNLLDFLAIHRPPEAGEDYGRGHDQATGGSLPYAVWNRFISSLGFGSEAQVAA